MKSILLKTLAAALLVAAAQAEVHVLGVVWKERGLFAPDGTIEPNPGTVAATRGYMIFDQTILTAAPAAGTLILYTDNRSDGSGPRRSYTIDTQFRGFKADLIDGATGGRRMYGHMFAPTSIANIPGSLIPFSGTPFASGYPNHLRLDDTVFQTGSATSLTGPIIVKNGTLFRSVLGGSATAVNVEATTIAGATVELEERLEKAGFSRGAVAPVITIDLPAAIALADGQQQTLSVGLGPNVFPAPTYRWFKGAVQVATTPTFTVTGGDPATGAGTYRVEVTTSAGTAVSSNAVVTPLQFTFATNLPPAVAILGANSTVLSVVLDPVPVTNPTYKWFKATTAAPTVFAAVAPEIGGTAPTLTVIGGEAATGAGVYRVEVTSTAGTITSASSTVTVTVPAAGTFAFTTNTPRTATAPFLGTSTISATVANAGAGATFQWFRAPASNPTVFVPVALGDGGSGTVPTAVPPGIGVLNLAVSGDNASSKGPGVYRVVVTRVAAPAATLTSINTVVTTAP